MQLFTPKPQHNAKYLNNVPLDTIQPKVNIFSARTNPYKTFNPDNLVHEKAILTADRETIAAADGTILIYA